MMIEPSWIVSPTQPEGKDQRSGLFTAVAGRAVKAN
jgi:hypothetical protein